MPIVEPLVASQEPGALRLFSLPSRETLEVMRCIHERRLPSFLLAAITINPSSARLAYLLHRIVGGSPSCEHKSFFCNSGNEALSGAVKLIRQASERNREVWVHDRRGELETAFNPAACSPPASPSAQVHFISDPAHLHDRLRQRTPAGFVYVAEYDDPEREIRVIRSLSSLCRGYRIAFCLDERHCDPWKHPIYSADSKADVCLFSETFNGGAIPFGAFVMHPAIYKVWDNINDFTVHTSTLGANTLATASVIDFLDRCKLVDSDVRTVMADIDQSFETTCEYYARFVNPKAVATYRFAGMDFDIRRADGMHLRDGKGRDVLDLTQNYGCGFRRGHNNPDVVSAVIDGFDRERDYCGELKELLCDLTGMDRCILGVSGATAVDTAVGFALAAARHATGRTKVVCFEGNYSGKTLISWNFSIRLPKTSTSNMVEQFAPNYHDLHYVDPFDANARGELEALLRGGEVALVWFETVQGSLCKPLPREVIDLVARCKSEGGYWIGVDEVLTGMWRTDTTFCSYQEHGLEVDVTAVGKAMTDLSFPISAALMTEEVYRCALSANPLLEARLGSYYDNPLGAAVAVNALGDVRENHDPQSKQDRMLRFRHELEASLKKSAAFEPELRGKGNLLRLRASRRWFPFRDGTLGMLFIEQNLASLLYERYGVMVVTLRLNMPIFCAVEDSDEALRRLQRAVDEIRPGAVYRHIAKRAFRFVNGSIRRWIATRSVG